jgi:hypothetical protein
MFLDSGIRFIHSLGAVLPHNFLDSFKPTDDISRIWFYSVLVGDVRSLLSRSTNEHQRTFWGCPSSFLIHEGIMSLLG